VSVRKVCDICHFARQTIDEATMEPVSDVRRYTLRREIDQTQKMGNRTRRYQQSAGGIDLCGECWERICKPNMNPRKSHGRKRP
jgi:hypothetical protein